MKKGKNTLSYVLAVLLFSACRPAVQPQPEVIHSAAPVEALQRIDPASVEPPFDLEQHLENYQNLKSTISRHRNNINRKTDLDAAAKIDLASQYLSSALVDSIFPYWLGTRWDFNGYTERPRDGDIACGYFVSTTIRDLGMKINRYKIAKKAAAEIIYALCESESIVTFSAFDDLVKHLEEVKNNEVLVVGLDFHVGFIFKKENQAYFAHSNYQERRGVEIQALDDPGVLQYSNIYVLGNFTQNKTMMKSWLH